VPRCAASFGGAVHERPQLVEQQERVGVGERDVSRERAPDLDAGSFDLSVRLNHAFDWTIGGLGRAGSWNAGKDEGVLDRDGRHRVLQPGLKA
jgi:hypothetical protein